MRYLKVFGHIILSVALVAAAGLLVGGLVALESRLWGSSPMELVATTTPVLVGLSSALLVPQWSRRIAISRRLIAVLVGLLVLTLAAVVTLLLVRLSPELASNIGIAFAPITIICSLLTMRLIAFPWPVPLARLWRGEIPLVSTYWVWYSLVGAMVVFLLTGVSQAAYYSTASTFLPIVSIGFIVLLYCFFAISIWRSAGYYKGRPVWRVLARLTSLLLLGYFGFVLVGLFADVAWIKELLYDPRLFRKSLEPK